MRISTPGIGFPTDPNFAAFGPSANRPAVYAVTAQDAGGGWVRVFDFASGIERFRFQPFGVILAIQPEPAPALLSAG